PPGAGRPGGEGPRPASGSWPETKRSPPLATAGTYCAVGAGGEGRRGTRLAPALPGAPRRAGVRPRRATSVGSDVAATRSRPEPRGRGRVGAAVDHLEDHLDLDRDATRERAHANGGSSVPPGLAEDLD